MEETKLIPHIYKMRYEQLGMFFFVEGQKQIVPTITLSQAIANYYKFINEQYDYNVAIVTLSRLRTEFIDLNYNKSCNNHCKK